MDLLKISMGTKAFAEPQMVAMCYVGSNLYDDKGKRSDDILRGVDSYGYFIVDRPNSHEDTLHSIPDILIDLEDCVFSAFKAYEYGLDLNVSRPYSYNDLLSAKLSYSSTFVRKITSAGRALVLTERVSERQAHIKKFLNLVNPLVVSISSLIKDGELDITEAVVGCDYIFFDIEAEFEDFSDLGHLRYVKQLVHGKPVHVVGLMEELYDEMLRDLKSTSLLYGVSCSERDVGAVASYLVHDIVDQKLYDKHVTRGKPIKMARVPKSF